jgi:hypothetical protein
VSAEGTRIQYQEVQSRRENLIPAAGKPGTGGHHKYMPRQRVLHRFQPLQFSQPATVLKVLPISPLFSHYFLGESLKLIELFGYYRPQVLSIDSTF